MAGMNVQVITLNIEDMNFPDFKKASIYNETTPTVATNSTQPIMTPEQAKELWDSFTHKEADRWVTKNPDSEVRRMYGHYLHAFKSGSLSGREETLLALENRIESMKGNTDSLERLRALNEVLRDLRNVPPTDKQ